MLFNIIPENLIAKKNESELVVYFKNGSIYQLKGSDDPDALRGPNPFGVIFDEYDTQKQEGWGVIEPIIRANGGWVWFIGTPRGKQGLFTLYHRGQEEHPEWKSWLLKASTSGIISADQLAEAKKSMTPDLYNQEWECEFLEGQGSVFRGVREIMYNLDGTPICKPEQPQKGHSYLMGVDLAKVKDYTVIRVYDRDSNCLVYSDRFNTLEWPFQKRRIALYAKYYNNAMTIVDSTGVGDPIADDLTRAGVGVVPFKIQEVNKREIIEKLSIWIEQRKFKMFPQKDALFEYDNFTYKIVPPNNKIRYEARSGLHDDIVMADALAVWYLNPIFIPEFTKEPNPTQIMLQRALREHQNQQEPYDGDGGDQYNPELSEWAESNYESF
jgi:hypothetical protein